MILGYEANIGLIYYGPKWSWAEMVMGRNGHGPKWLWAEMTRNRDVYANDSLHGVCFPTVYMLVGRKTLSGNTLRVGYHLCIRNTLGMVFGLYQSSEKRIAIFIS